MVSRDYTKELGLEPATRKVPWPIAAAILAAAAGLMWFGISKLDARSDGHNAHHAGAAKTAAPSQAHN